ncbi:MAG: glycosyltransferase family 39 protein [Corynebacteriales bacterium]|nr:glycosyltransferase family 39 protein [Mycobacteriales bacterium]
MTATLTPKPSAMPVCSQHLLRTPHRPRVSRFRRLIAGRPDAPRWERPALFVLLLGTALLYLWNLSASGYANTYYAAAAQAGSENWKALFFGSLDAGNAITVDKPPASLWLMGLSGQVFGFSSWSMLAPQALCGVAAVGFLYAAVRRWSGPVAGMIAGAGLALTPVAVLMFRFNNPDALLVLLLVIAAYCLIRALETASTTWLLLVGTAIGFGFLTKMLQALLVVPAFGLVYLIAAPTPLRRRMYQLLCALAAMVVSAGWYVAIVELWPASSRPYIGGSENNSILELTMGYNGLGRIFGGSGNGGGGGVGGGNTGFGGATGIDRLVGDSMGTEISWLLPAALIGLVAGLWFTRRAPRTDRTRAALVLWGGWLIVTALVFSFMSGTMHPYYTVALAPAIAALIAISGRELWRGRAHLPARLALAAMVVATGGWSYELLSRNSDWHPELRIGVLIISLVVAAGLLVGSLVPRRLVFVLATLSLAVGLSGSGAYALATASVAHSGSIPTSGPSGQMSGGPGGAMLFEGAQDAQVPGGQGLTSDGTRMGGPGEANTSAELITLLRASDARWAAATSGAQSAAGMQLSSGRPVMAMGGFTGSDPAPTLAEFQEYVANGDIGYYVAGGGMGGPSGGSSDITSWVAANYTAVTVGGQTVYDLSEPLA